MNFFKNFIDDITNKENWKSLTNKEDWKAVKNDITKVIPKITPKSELLKDPSSKVFLRAWNKAVTENQLYNTEIPNELINTYKLGQRREEREEPLPKQQTVEDSYPAYTEREEFFTKPTTKKEYTEPTTERNVEVDIPNVEVDKEGMKHIRRPTIKKKIVLQTVSNKELDRVKWALEKVGKLDFTGEPTINNGVRSSYISFKLEADSIRKANGGSATSAIQKSLGDKSVRAKVFLENGGNLIVVLTKSSFSPLYTEHNFNLLKEEGDFILGEIKGKVRVLNIKKMSQAHLGVVGGSESGKSFFLNNVIQSIAYSSPTAEFYLFSPKSDDKGGDFSKFANYPQVKVCEIIGDGADAEMNMLLKLRDVLETQLENIHRQKKVPLQIIAIDELVYLLELKKKPTKPKKPSDEDEDWEWERYEKSIKRYKTDIIKEELVELLEDFAKLGRKIGRLIVGTQLLNKTVMSNQFMANVEQISFKVAVGNGVMSGFNSLAEDLLPRGDGLATDPNTNETINFQGLLATP